MDSKKSDEGEYKVFTCSLKVLEERLNYWHANGWELVDSHILARVNPIESGDQGTIDIMLLIFRRRRSDR